MMVYIYYLFALVLLLDTLSLHAYPGSYSGDIKVISAGDSFGNMGIANFEVAQNDNCKLATNVPAAGFVVGQTYTWTASTNFGGAGLGIIIDIASTRQHTSGRASDKTFTWTPGDTTTVTGHAICGAGGTTEQMWVAVPKTVTAAPLPAKCSTITDHATLCADNGNNGLIDNPASTACSTPTCTKANDAAICCKPLVAAKCNTFSSCSDASLNKGAGTSCTGTTSTCDAATCCNAPAKCSTITDHATLCANNGNNGLIFASSTTDCVSTTCTKVSDAVKCCKAAPMATCDNYSCTDAALNKGSSVECEGVATSTCTSIKCCNQPAAAATATKFDTKMSFVHKVTGSNIEFDVTCAGCGWFGLGVSKDGKMGSSGEGSDLVVCDGTNTVKRYSATAQSAPSGGTAVPGATCSTAAGTMKFTRALAADSSAATKQREIPSTAGTNVKLIFAYGASGSNTMKYHATRGSKTVALIKTAGDDNTTGTGTGTGTDTDTDTNPNTDTNTDTSPSPKDGMFTLNAALGMSATFKENGDVDVVVTYKSSTGWFGVGMTSDGTMTSSGSGTDAVLCQPGTAEGGVQRFWMTSKTKPSDGREMIGATCEVSSGVSTMKFTRKMAAESDKERAMVENGDSKIVFAYHDTSNTLAMHSTRGAATVDFSSDKKTAVIEQGKVSGMVWGHGITMMLSWGLLLPVGVLCARYQRKNEKKMMSMPFWFAMHKFCQYTGWFLQIIGFVLIFVGKGGGHFSSSLTVGLLHMFFGLVIVVLGTLQPLNAFFRPHPNDENGNKTKKRQQWEYLHKGTGYFAVIGGPINCALGVLMVKSLNYDSTFVSVTAAMISMTGVPFVVYILYKEATKSRSKETAKVSPQPDLEDVSPP